MPKQIISDVVGELLETGKRTGQQLGKLPGEMVEEAAKQTGIRLKTEEEKKEAAQIQKLKEEDEKKKSRQIAFFKKQIAGFQEPPVAKPSSPQEQIAARQQEMTALEEGKKKELPSPVLAVKRKVTRVERKIGPSG